MIGFRRKWLLITRCNDTLNYRLSINYTVYTMFSLDIWIFGIWIYMELFPRVWAKEPFRRQSQPRRTFAVCCLFVHIIPPPAEGPCWQHDAEEDNHRSHSYPGVQCGRKHIVCSLASVTKHTQAKIRKGKGKRNSLYLDHQAGFDFFNHPLNTTLTTHQELKLMPVAGGTRLIAPNATGHDR